MFDVDSERYAHLQGLNEEEIELVMLIADVAILEAKEIFHAEEEQK